MARAGGKGIAGGCAGGEEGGIALWHSYIKSGYQPGDQEGKTRRKGKILCVVRDLGP